MLKSKSDTESDNYRNKGNKLFEKRQMLQALKCFNAALTYAESKEKQALAYANRSAAYLQAKKYEECLINIQWARENGYPDEKIQKLIEREEKCKKLLEENVKDPADDPMEFFKLSYPANPKIPFIIDSIELKTENGQRGLYAKHDLKAGDVIAWEEMSFTRIFCPGQYNRCCYCLKSNMMNLIPCQKTASMMFCSHECRDKTYQLYGDDIDFMIVNASMVLNSDRILIDIEDIFGGREELLKFLNENDIKSMKKTIFDFDWTDEKNHKKFQMISLFSLPKAAPLVLSFTPPSFKIVRGNEKYLELLAQMNRVINFNFSHVTYEHQISQQTSPEAVHDGFAVVLFIDVLGYSCMNNIDQVYVDNKIFYYTVKPVKKGEQLNASKLGLEYHKTLMKQRQALYLNMHFKCTCYACLKDLKPQDFKCLDPRVLKEAIERSEMAWRKTSKTKAQLEENWKIITARCEDMLSVEVPTLKLQNSRMIRDLAYSATFPC